MYPDMSFLSEEYHDRYYPKLERTIRSKYPNVQRRTKAGFDQALKAFRDCHGYEPAGWAKNLAAWFYAHGVR